MDWMQVLFIFISNASLILWFRSESRSDWRHMDNKLDTFMRGMQQEAKDFHDRLIEIEIDKKNKERRLK